MYRVCQSLNDEKLVFVLHSTSGHQEVSGSLV